AAPSVACVPPLHPSPACGGGQGGGCVPRAGFPLPAPPPLAGEGVVRLRLTGMPTQKTIGEAILEAEAISLSFGGVKALTGVSLAIRRHEILAIIGPNGAGKTSMLNVINGFYHP